MNTEPVRNLIKAIDAHRAGDNEEALARLSEAVGAEGPTPYMRDQLPKLLEEPHDVVIALAVNQAKQGD